VAVGIGVLLGARVGVGGSGEGVAGGADVGSTTSCTMGVGTGVGEALKRAHPTNKKRANARVGKVFILFLRTGSSGTIIIQIMSLSLPLKILLVAATAALISVWLVKTPPGLLGKIDAIGYAVCHQAPARSFLIGDRPTPLCARCSGMYLGALAGIIYLMRLGRRGEIPPLKIGLVLIFFVAAFGLDGLNSFSRLIPGFPFLYQSQNWLRLATGTGMGLGIAAVLVPVFNQAVWIDYNELPALGEWRHLGILFILGILLDLGVYSQNPLLIYPLAVLSGLGVLVILSMVYTIIWVLFSKTENRYYHIQELWVPLLAGFLTAMLQISLIDTGRFLLTGTWAGIPLPN